MSRLLDPTEVKSLYEVADSDFEKLSLEEFEQWCKEQVLLNLIMPEDDND